MKKGITRRAMLAFLPAAGLAAQTTRSRPKAKPLPAVGEFVRFTDPTTETSVVRLTSVKSSSYLPAAVNRFVSVKERTLTFSSDRNGGVLAPFQVDLRTGLVRQLATPSKLVTQSLCLDPKEHWLYFLDGEQLARVDVSNKKEVKHSPEVQAEGVNAFSLAPDGTVFVIRQGSLERADDPGHPLASEVGTTCLARSGGCLFSRELDGDSGREFWYVAGSATANAKPVLLAKGRVSDPYWAPDGQALLFLRQVSHQPDVLLSEIHQVGMDGMDEQCVAPTSMFAGFAPNFDASVFVGASRSKAQPNVVLLLRTAKREMTLCQHHASRAAAVSPVFSPDARRVYFQSDEEGKPAIYSVNVELLVEPPGEGTEG